MALCQSLTRFSATDYRASHFCDESSEKVTVFTSKLTSLYNSANLVMQDLLSLQGRWVDARRLQGLLLLGLVAVIILGFLGVLMYLGKIFIYRCF